MSAKEIKAGSAYVELTTKDAKLMAGLNRAQAKLKAWGAGIATTGKWIAGLGVAITAPLLAAAKASADSGAKLYDMSKRTGIAVEALSALGYAADVTGTDIDTVEGAIRRMQKTVAGIKDDLEGTTAGVDFLGDGFTALIKGQNPAEQFRQIAQRIAEIPDATERAAAAQKVFGKSGTMLLPMIERYAELEAEARKFGLVRTEQSAKDAKDLSVALYLAERAMKSLWGALASAVTPALKQKTERVIRLTLVIRDWIRQNQSLVAMVFQVGMALTIAGTALIIFGKIVSGLGIGLGLLTKVIPAVTGTVSGLVSAATLLLNPLGLVLAALAIGAAAWFAYSDSGSQALSQLKSDALEAFDGIAEALKRGDIEQAAQILWAFLKLEWEQGKTALMKTWEDFKRDFAKLWNEIWVDALTAWEIFRTTLTTSFNNLTTALAKLLMGLADTMANVANNPTFKKLEKAAGYVSPVALIGKKVVGEVAPVSPEERIKQFQLLDLQNAADNAAERERSNKALTDLSAQLKKANTDADKTASNNKATIDDGAFFRLRDALAEFRAQIGNNSRAATQAGGMEHAAPIRRAQQNLAVGGSAAGTFDPNAVRGLGATSPMLREQKDTNKKLDTVVRVNQQLIDYWRQWMARQNYR